MYDCIVTDGTMQETVVDVVGITLRHHINGVLMGTVDNRQMAGRRTDQVVVGRHVLPARHHVEGSRLKTAHIIAHQDTMGGIVGDRRRLAGHYVGKDRFFFTVMLAARVFDVVRIRNHNGHIALRDCQRGRVSHRVGVGGGFHHVGQGTRIRDRRNLAFRQVSAP